MISEKKIKAVIILFSFCLALSWSCSREKTYGDASPLSVLQRMQSAKNMKDILSCYTDGTVTVIRKTMDQRNMSEQAVSARMALVGPDTAWECLREDVKNDTARCEIIITGHPVDNVVGSAITLTMRRVDGKWHIDMEDEMTRLLSEYRDDGIGDYVKKKFSGY